MQAPPRRPAKPQGFTVSGAAKQLTEWIASARYPLHAASWNPACPVPTLTTVGGAAIRPAVPAGAPSGRSARA